MIVNSPIELLAEIKKYMDINNIQDKELGVLMGKSQQSISQYFKHGSPNISTLFEMCNALNLSIDINFIEN